MHTRNPDLILWPLALHPAFASYRLKHGSWRKNTSGGEGIFPVKTTRWHSLSKPLKYESTAITAEYGVFTHYELRGINIRDLIKSVRCVRFSHDLQSSEVLHPLVSWVQGICSTGYLGYSPSEIISSLKCLVYIHWRKKYDNLPELLDS